AKHFNDEKLVDFILASEKMPNTQLRAMMLKSNLPSYWKTSGKSAEDVFAILKLKNVDKDKLFENPMWSTWVAFLQKDTRNPDEKMFAVLKNQYGEEGLRTMIANAKNSEATEMIGTKLQQEFWRSEGKTADDVFQLLKLSYEGDAFLQSPALSTWVSYATHLQKIQLTNHEYYKYGAVMELEKHYSHTDLARKVSDAMVLATTTKNSKMEKAIGVLQTQQFKQMKTFILITQCVSYVANVDRRNPDGLMFHTLANQYGKEGLKALVANAKKNKGAETIVVKLQQKLWGSEMKTADGIFNFDNLIRNDFGAITELDKHFPYIELMIGATMQRASMNGNILVEKAVSIL
ncbi:hypothetical protein PHMEG_00034507, partial [Phytophthora megakarya]